MSELQKTQEIPNRSAILVNLILPSSNEEEAQVSLAELARLLDTAGGILFATVTQARPTPDPRTFIGKGKVEEIAQLCKNNGVSLVIFDHELSPSQIRNLENEFGPDVRVLDRSMLILDIFALHATTGEGKLQVELAQLKYTVPRLIGAGKDLSKLGGGIGTRGPGESQLETDRRHIHRRMEALEAELKEVKRNRLTQRKQREKSGLRKIAIAGYTNAGKSTLLNALTDAGILAEDKLFATLDPTTRKCILPSGQTVLLTDTVGLIRNLPHHLIHAFSSTLEEVKYADVILILCDASDPEYASQLEVTEKLLCDLGASDKPILYGFNKADCAPPRSIAIPAHLRAENVIFLSAKTGDGIPNLLSRLEALLRQTKAQLTFTIPLSDSSVLNTLYQLSQVLDVAYGANEITVTALADDKVRGMLRRYLPKEETKEDEF